VVEAVTAAVLLDLLWEEGCCTMEMTEIRKQIDEVDEGLLALFLRRMELSEAAASYKNEHALPVLDRQREREILAKVAEQAGDRELYAYHLFTTLIQLSKARHNELFSAPSKVPRQDRTGPCRRRGRSSPRRHGRLSGVEGSKFPDGLRKAAARGNIVYVKTFGAGSTRWSPVCASTACCRSRTAPTVRASV
jgi:chorismate mutase/prephenate dehydratase